MDFWTYLAVLVVTTLISYALAPKPPRQKAPTLEDFDLPTAEEGRSIPWIFGTYLVTDPNVIWYGDLEVRTKTKDKVKTRIYRMGIQLEVCIGPVDALVALQYGGKDLGIAEVTSSQQIFIDHYNLFGGRDREGGIEGYFDICFGESTQAVNDYLAAQIGTPLSAYRDSLTIVGRKPNLVANSTYIKPLLPTVRCITAGWADGTCWYEETAAISPADDTTLRDLVESHSPAMYLRFEEPLDGQETLQGDAVVNDGSGPDGEYELSGVVRPGIVSDGVQAIGMWDDAGIVATDIVFPHDSAYSYCDNDQISIVVKIRTRADYRSTANHYVWHEGDHNLAFNQGLGVYLTASSTDSVTAIYYNSGFKSATVNLPYQLANSSAYFLCIQLSTTGGANSTGYLDVYVGCDAEHAGSADFPAFAVPTTTVGTIVGANRTNFDQSLHIKADLDSFVIVTSSLTQGQVSALASAYCGGGLDMNPAHIIYKCLTHLDQGASEPSATIDDDNFRAAADTFYAESFGLSMQWRNEGPIHDFISEVCRHAGAVMSLDPRTGKTKIIPLRDDYDVDTLDLFTEDDVIEVTEWQDAADGEAVNEVTVIFRERDASEGTASWVNRASVQQQGVSHETIQFPGIPTRALAARVAKRECMQRSSNLSRGKIKVNRSTWDKLPGSVFRFSHAGEGIEELVLRVVDLDVGTLTDGAITITVVQDVFSLDDVLTDIGTQGSEWVEPDSTPAAATAQVAIEAPYWQLLGDLVVAETGSLADDVGYVVALAGKPTGLSTGYNIWSRISPADYVEAAEDQAFWPTATLTSALDRVTAADIALTGSVDLDLVEEGWLAVIGTGSAAEFCYVDAVDYDADTVSISRGRLDTTPQEHDAATRVWFLEGNAADWPRDPTVRSDADAVNVKAQTIAGGVLDLADATAMNITMDSRQVRPYPPGDFAVNGEAHPVSLEGTLTVSWAHRDRITQGLTHVSQYDATDYGPEAGTTYNAYAYNDDTSALLDSDTGISGTSWSPAIAESCTLRIEVESVRDGYLSWQRQVREFEYVGSLAMLIEDGDEWITEAGELIDEG